MTKKLLPLICSFGLLCSTPSHADGWLDSLKSMLGLGGEQTEQVDKSQEQSPSINGLMDSLKSLGVTDAQIKGGVAALLNYVKTNISNEQFQQLANTLPGSQEVISALPDISKLSTESGLSGLLDKAGEYNDSVKAINEVKKQFQALGLSPDMIGQYSSKIQEYLNTPQGMEAKNIIQDGLGKLLG